MSLPELFAIDGFPSNTSASDPGSYLGIEIRNSSCMCIYKNYCEGPGRILNMAVPEGSRDENTRAKAIYLSTDHVDSGGRSSLLFYFILP